MSEKPSPKLDIQVSNAQALARRMDQQLHLVERVLAEAPAPQTSLQATAPFINSLGMPFVPAGTPGVLFGVWQTRRQDFEAFVNATGHDAISKNAFGWAAFTSEEKDDGGLGCEQKGGSWYDPHFSPPQTGEHPVVCVSYLDAEAFCAWVTKKERASGKIPATASYRLPTDSEWSRACGSTEYPWGDHWPPQSSDGNYLGAEAMMGAWEGCTNGLVKAGFRDSWPRTAPVGLFTGNRYGLHDMGGNVWEWCSTWYTADLNEADAKEVFAVLGDYRGGQTHRLLRGASWGDSERMPLRSSSRISVPPWFRYNEIGFRCVLVVAGG